MSDWQSVWCEDDWKNEEIGLVKALFSLSCQCYSDRSWLKNVCCLHRYVAYKIRGETAQGLHLNASNKSSLTEGGHWIIFCIGTLSFCQYVFAHILHLLCSFKMNPDLYISSFLAHMEIFFFFYHLVNYLVSVSLRKFIWSYVVQWA